MSREQSTLRCKLENFEAIREKRRRLGYKVYFRDLRYGDMVIAGKYKLKEVNNGLGFYSKI